MSCNWLEQLKKAWFMSCNWLEQLEEVEFKFHKKSEQVECKVGCVAYK